MAADRTREIFISYSHRDVEWRRRLDSFLRIFPFLPQEETVGLRYWSDEDIATGAHWETEIEQAIDRASAAVLLISADFLSSEFIMKREVKMLLDRKDSANLPILPFIIRPCPWDAFDWIQRLNIFRQGEALSTLSHAKQDACLTELFREIETYLHPPTSENGGDADEPPDTSGKKRATEPSLRTDRVTFTAPVGQTLTGQQYRFMSKASLIEMLATHSDENVVDAVQIYRTSTQSTWIAATRRRVFCVLDSERTFRKGRLLQWSISIPPIPTVVARKSEKSRVSGLVDIGGRQNWLFTRALFNNDPIKLKTTLDDLFSRAARS